MIDTSLVKVPAICIRDNGPWFTASLILAAILLLIAGYQYFGRNR